MLHDDSSNIRRERGTALRQTADGDVMGGEQHSNGSNSTIRKSHHNQQALLHAEGSEHFGVEGHSGDENLLQYIALQAHVIEEVFLLSCDELL
jgi:hypothetical protein